MGHAADRAANAAGRRDNVPSGDDAITGSRGTGRDVVMLGLYVETSGPFVALSYARLPLCRHPGVRRRGLFLFQRGRRRLGDQGLQPQFAPQLGFELGGYVPIFLQELLHVFPSLADPFALVAEPGAGLFDDLFGHAQVEQVALAGDALTVHDVEFSLAKWGGRLVLHDLDLGPGAHDDVAVFDGGDAPNIDAHRGIKLKRTATGGGLGIAEHDADFLADLVDEDQAGARFGDDAGQLAQRLRHEARLKAHVAVAHLAFEFGLGDQRRDRIDHQHVDGVRAHQRFGNLQRLFAVIRLGYEEVIDVHAEFFGVDRVQRVFGVDEGGHAAGLLRLGDHLKRDGGLAARLRPKNLYHAAAREAAHAERCVERNGAGGNDGDGDDRLLAPQAHNGAFAKLFFDLREGQIDCPGFFLSFVSH